MKAEQSELRRIDPETGEVPERLEMPAGVAVSGLEADGAGVFLLRWRRQRQSARRAQAQAMTIEKGVRDVSRVPGQGFDALGKIRLSSASTAMARPTSFSSSRR